LANPLGIGDPGFGWKQGLLLAIGLLLIAGGVTALLSPSSAFLRALSGQRGRLLVASTIAAYFLILALVGGQSAWDRLGVSDLQPSFADMRSVTSAWECDRQGVSVLPHNPCDPYGGRPANYPTIWLWPSVLGIGQEATVALGVATGLIFFASFLVVIGNPGIREAVLYSFAAISPAVMLGVERGNVDLLMFAMLVAAVFVFRRGLAGRLAGYALLLFAAILKLFPALAWGILFRQPRRLALHSCAVIVGLFAVYIAATFDTIRVISDVVPQSIGAQYGADVGVDSLQEAANAKTGLGWLTRAGDWLTVAALTAGAGIIAGFAWRRRTLEASVPTRGGTDLALDAFIAGVGIYVFSFALLHNYDYRLIFLLMALPQLIIWTRASRSPVPAPRLTLAALLGTLWLSEPLTGGPGFWTPALDFIPYDKLGVGLDEILNWMLFVTLGAGLVLATVPLAVRNRIGVPVFVRRRKAAVRSVGHVEQPVDRGRTD
jgi:hypothetical protein